MRTPVLLGLTALVAATTALAVDFGTSQSNSLAAQPVLDFADTGSEELDALRSELAEVRSELESLRAMPSRSAPADRRNEVIDIEAAVRAVLEEEGLLAAGAAIASAEALMENGELVTVEDLVAMLLAGDLDEDEWNSIWAKARAAGLTKELVAAFEERAEQNPNDAEAQAQVGFAYISTIAEIPDGPEKGAWGMKADAAFDRALEIDPDHWQARFTKAFSLSFWPPIFGKQAEAISNFEILIEKQGNMAKSSDHAQTFLMLGNLYQQTGEGEKAAAIWAQGAAQFPDDAELLGRVSNAGGN